VIRAIVALAYQDPHQRMSQFWEAWLDSNKTPEVFEIQTPFFEMPNSAATR
jgi:hypothetical protein